jgi:GntR family transcriptional regulator / MocR family aminotransferase
VTDLTVVLDRDAPRPLADQLADELRQAAVQGRLRVGERLPSTRALAASLAVSRTVTAAAYDQLLAEGWLTGRRGAGTFVVAVPLIGPAGRPPAPSAVEPGPGAQVVDLRPGSPWTAGIRRDVWRRAWRSAADHQPEQRPLRAGRPEFRRAVAEHVVRHRGLLVDPSAVLATAGTTGAVTELALAVLRPGDIVAVEEPGYPRAVGALRSAGLRVRPAPVDGDGLIVDELPAGARAVYCTPAHQFPLGGRLPASRRVDLVAWAREQGAWLIEDDYDGELRYDVAPLPLLASVGPDVVIHLGTTSKILTPSLGVGWLAGPPDVVTSVLAHRNAAGTGAGEAGQRVFTALVDTGDLSRHLRRVRKELAARRELVVGALTAAGSAVLGDEAGGHVVIPLADLAAEQRLLATASESGVLLDGLSRCFVGTPTTAGVTVGYAAPANAAELRAALPGLGSLLTGDDREYVNSVCRDPDVRTVKSGQPPEDSAYGQPTGRDSGESDDRFR